MIYLILILKTKQLVLIICNSCLNKNKFNKNIKLSLTTKIFILSIQRYDKRRNIKNECEIMIPEILDISKYCSNDISDNNNIYQILGIINHTGEVILVFILHLLKWCVIMKKKYGSNLMMI